MEKRRKNFTIDQIPNKNIKSLEGFVNPGVIKRVDSIRELPDKGPGRHSLRRAVERRKAERITPQVDLYGFKEAKLRRRQENLRLL